MRVVVIIPTYNEKENIGRMLEVMQDLVAGEKDDYQILIVDDNSPDGTAEIVKNFMNKHKNVFLTSGRKEGLGVAMIRGIKYGINKLRADVIVSNEADFAFDPKHIPFMVGKIKEGYDVVVGSRHVGVGKTKGWTAARKINHWMANKLFATWVAGVTEVYDHNGAFRAIRVANVADKIDLNKLKTKGFGFFNYYLFKLTEVTDKFYEFPVTYKFRISGESKVSFNPRYFGTYLRDVFEYIILAFKIRLKKLTIDSRRPRNSLRG